MFLSSSKQRLPLKQFVTSSKLIAAHVELQTSLKPLASSEYHKYVPVHLLLQNNVAIHFSLQTPGCAFTLLYTATARINAATEISIAEFDRQMIRGQMLGRASLYPRSPPRIVSLHIFGLACNILKDGPILQR
eukprot:TRINITY_DN6525_c0_g1_i7.p3 TRINITY_DN6525_c0_g1~~TRINITY_DN6525_c0_g1_i7.p3  ORF type:complete len:133 (-),score=4.04 TRINITY_DN6525_c0_g1_i7:136-534(-)